MIRTPIPRQARRRGVLALKATVLSAASFLVLLNVADVSGVVFDRRMMEHAARRGLEQALEARGVYSVTDIQRTVARELAESTLDNVQIRILAIDPQGRETDPRADDAALAIQVEADSHPGLLPLGVIRSRVHLQVRAVASAAR